MSEEQVSQIFYTYEELRQFHETFLEELKKEAEKPTDLIRYGNLFLSHAEEIENIYTEHCAAQALSHYIRTDATKNNPKFAAFLKERLKMQECRRLDFKSFLLKPVQRVCKVTKLESSFL